MDLYIAIQFLTRIPLPFIKHEERRIASSISFFPVVGLIIGGLLLLLYKVGLNFLKSEVVLGFVVIAYYLITGGMHLDGFADTLDGLFSGKEQKTKLDIMRDSRVGAYGVMGIVLLILIKYLLLSSISTRTLPKAFLIFPLQSRWAMTFCISCYPYARKEGLGRVFSRHKRPKYFVISTILAITLSYIINGLWSILTLCMIFIGAVLFGKRIFDNLGGHTGDTYGAINEIMEVFSLLSFSIQSFYGG